MYLVNIRLQISRFLCSLLSLSHFPLSPLSDRPHKGKCLLSSGEVENRGNFAKDPKKILNMPSIFGYIIMCLLDTTVRSTIIHAAYAKPIDNGEQSAFSLLS